MRCVAAAVVLLVAVSGCSSGEAAPAEVGPLASASVSAGADKAGDLDSPSRTAAASPSPTAPLREHLEPPAEALRPTAKGASAFTKHFFVVVNAAYQQRDSAAVQRLSAPQCNSCASITADIERLEKSDIRVDGRRFILQYAEAAPLEQDGSIFVDFAFTSDAYVESLPDGSRGDADPAASITDGQARLIRSGDRWLVSGLRLVEDA